MGVLNGLDSCQERSSNNAKDQQSCLSWSSADVWQTCSSKTSEQSSRIVFFWRRKSAKATGASFLPKPTVEWGWEGSRRPYSSHVEVAFSFLDGTLKVSYIGLFAKRWTCSLISEEDWGFGQAGQNKDKFRSKLSWHGALLQHILSSKLHSVQCTVQSAIHNTQCLLQQCARCALYCTVLLFLKCAHWYNWFWYLSQTNTTGSKDTIPKKIMTPPGSQIYVVILNAIFYPFSISGGSLVFASDLTLP